MHRTSTGTSYNGSSSVYGGLISTSDYKAIEQTYPIGQVQKDLDQGGFHGLDNPHYSRRDNTKEDSFVFEEICAIIQSKEFLEGANQQNIDYPGQVDVNRANPIGNDKYFASISPSKLVYLNDDNNLHEGNFAQLAPTTNEQYYTMVDPSNMNEFNMDDKNYMSFPQPLCNPTDNQQDISTRPFVEIVEQPARCALRFRYKCEGRSAGSLPGANSTADNKTFPTIRINNCKGRAVVVVSCVTKDEPFKAHPHNIVGREGCKKGICTIIIPNNDSSMVRSFSSLGIQCVKRKDIEESLAVRKSINVDPFRQGFEHKSNAANIDLNAVRLCFQVFIEGSTPGKCDVPLEPVVSEPIHDKKAMSDLVITKLSHCSAPATGGREVILLCDRIAKDDITIRFYEERDGKLIWETYYEPSCTDIHKQVAICFKTPKYYDENIQQPVTTRIQLKRISDGQVSEPRLFQFLPCESDEDIILRKRQKIDWVNSNRLALNNILQPPVPSVEHQQHYQHPIQHHQPHRTTQPYQHMEVHGRVPSHGRPSEPSTSNRLSPNPCMVQQPPQNMIETQNLVRGRDVVDSDGKFILL